MATRYEVNSGQQHHFISSGVYYGYVPVSAPATTNNGACNDNCMDVDVNDCSTVQQMKNKFNDFGGQQQMVFVDKNCSKTKKRAYEKEELTNYVPKLKKFKEESQSDATSQEYQISLQASINKSTEFGFRHSGECFNFSCDQPYNQYKSDAIEMCRSALLHLSSPIDFDTAHQAVKQESLEFRSKNNCNDEFEDMLLLTHGCSSYHHFKEEAEF